MLFSHVGEDFSGLVESQ